MKKVRECFHMLITAVICLMVSMVPGKNVTAAIAENNDPPSIYSHLSSSQHVQHQDCALPTTTHVI